MSRNISASLLSALTGATIEPFYAVEFMFDTRTVTDINGNDFDVAPLRLWTGIGNRTIEVQGSNQVFVGTGALLSIGGLSEVNDLSAKSLSITLTGLNSDILSIALQEPYQRREFRLYFGEKNSSDVIQIFSGKMDKMTISDDENASTIQMQVESNLVELERSSGWRYTQENHKSRYEGDSFFSFVQTIQDQQVAWGRSSD